jgi:alpha-N-arabinofuranosidase
MMKTTRRDFALTLAGAPFILRGQQAPLCARIKVNTERVIGDIDPLIYGNFIEHLGRCIDDGVFDETSVLRPERLPPPLDRASPTALHHGP